jgi:hypothetical protein
MYYGLKKITIKHGLNIKYFFINQAQAQTREPIGSLSNSQSYFGFEILLSKSSLRIIFHSSLIGIFK